MRHSKANTPLQFPLDSATSPWHSCVHDQQRGTLKHLWQRTNQRGGAFLGARGLAQLAMCVSRLRQTCRQCEQRRSSLYVVGTQILAPEKMAKTSLVWIVTSVTKVDHCVFPYHAIQTWESNVSNYSWGKKEVRHQCNLRRNYRRYWVEGIICINAGEERSARLGYDMGLTSSTLAEVQFACIWICWQRGMHWWGRNSSRGYVLKCLQKAMK